MKKFSLIVVALSAWISAAQAAPIAQVDQITLSGATYPGDQWILTLSAPIVYTMTYTVPLGADFGCNICNVTAGWGASINADAVLSTVLTASYDVWDGVSVNEFGAADYDPIILLTALIPGQPFLAAVAVIDGFDGGNPLPVGVNITTLVPASNDPPMAVPASSSLVLLIFGLLLCGASRFFRIKHALLD
ncbi:MAG: hypothetical protein SFV21_17140 [Rhodospirillaceae bacterium]|nr:hypothetical protein [Rhodospirillaceae bacterium]